MMWRKIIAVALLCGLLAAGAGAQETSGTKVQAAGSGLSGIALISRAEALRAAGELTEAARLYKEGFATLKADDPEEARYSRICRDGLISIDLVRATYSLDERAADAALATAYPEWAAAGGNAQGAARGLERFIIDGKPLYTADLVDNVQFRDMKLMHADEKKNSLYARLVSQMVERVASVWPKQSWKTYDYPATYTGLHTIEIPRDRLPAAGLFKLWIPLPITLAYQQPAEILSVEPAEYVALPPSSAGRVSTLYMEIPLEKIMGPLKIDVRFKFTHYEQHFKVEPALVGAYNTADPEYIEYTKSSGNIEVTPEIQATAKKVVGDEKNPYLAARKIYDYMMKTVDYSYMPHLIFDPRSSLTESAYVQEYKVGDCGSQAMYFAALCRAVGIPARTPGGWQLFTNNFASHFWAEFYVPNYGWVPVDPSAGQMSLYTDRVDSATRQAYTDFFFGRQDAYRCVVQTNVDEPFVPVYPGMSFIPLAIQNPVASCDAMDPAKGEDVLFTMLEFSTLKVEKADVSKPLGL